MKYTRKFVLVPNERYEEMHRKLEEQKLFSEKRSKLNGNQTQQGSGEVTENPLMSRSTVFDDVVKSDPVVNKQPLMDIDSTRNNDKLDTEDIVGTLGKPYRHKARELLKLIQRTDPTVFTWTSSGEIKYNGQLIHGSNIIDLIRSVMYKTKIHKPPGHLEFKHYLRQINVPLTLVGNLKSIDSIEKNQHKAVSIKNDVKIKLGRKVEGKHVQNKRRKMWISL